MAETSHDPMGSRVRGLGLVAIVPALVMAGCGLIFSESASAPGEERSTAVEPDERANDRTRLDDAEDLPGGYGTLRQEQISMHLRRGELEMLVTPLDEAVTRTTAPDTWERLSSLARTHRTTLREQTGTEAMRLFLVALYSESQAVAFQPDDLTLVSRGLRFRPLEIHGLTPGWDRQRVGPRETLLAIYVFPEEVDLGREVEVEYQEVRTRDWERILPLVQAEQGRVRARAGGPL